MAERTYGLPKATTQYRCVVDQDGLWQQTGIYSKSNEAGLLAALRFHRERGEKAKVQTRVVYEDTEWEDAG